MGSLYSKLIDVIEQKITPMAAQLAAEICYIHS